MDAIPSLADPVRTIRWIDDAEPAQRRCMASSVPKHVVVLCHPEEASFNATVAREYCAAVEEIGHEVLLRDLYRMNFDPVLKAQEQPDAADYARSDDVAAELELLAGASVFVLVYPIWFGTPSAMMKGYVERVLGSGFSHRAVRARAPNPLLTGAHLLSLTSSGTTKQWLDEQGAWLSLRNVFDEYLQNAFSMKSADHVHFSAVVEGLKERFVDEYLKEVRGAARKVSSVAASERHNAAVRSILKLRTE